MNHQDAPGLSNTGAQNLKPSTHLIDWYSFTIANTLELSDVFDLLELDPDRFMKLAYGRLGYKTVHQWGDISILSDGPIHNGIHVQMTGNGCRQYENGFLCGVEEGWLSHFRRIRPYSPRTARLDVAMDIYTLDVLKQLREAIRTGNLVSKFKTVKFIDSATATGENLGSTIYLGSRTSRVMVRVYDKGREQGLDTLWQRMELELKGDRADAFVSLFESGYSVGELFSGVVNHYLSPRVPDGTDNKTNWPVATWWIDLFKEAANIRLASEKPKQSAEDLTKWFEQNMAPTLSVVFEHKGMGDMKYLVDLILLGSVRRSERHRLMLNESKRSDRE